jgi:hypothetical protein
MKKMITLSIAVVAAIMIMGSCKVCTECTESHTGVTSEFCGTNKQVNDYEDDLKEIGSQAGQNWNCERK